MLFLGGAQMFGFPPVPRALLLPSCFCGAYPHANLPAWCAASHHAAHLGCSRHRGGAGPVGVLPNAAGSMAAARVPAALNGQASVGISEMRALAHCFRVAFLVS